MKKLQKENNIFKKYFIWIVLFAIIGGAIYGLTLIVKQSKNSRPGQIIAIQGKEHISENSPLPKYNSNPPTSGPHARPVKGGFYSSELKDINVIHNLEHGFVWITYKNIDDKTITELEKIGRRYSRSVVISPRKANDSTIALASWGRLEKMKVFNEKQILYFIKKNRNRSPERLAR